MKTLLSFTGSPPKGGILCLIAMIAMMMSFSKAAARADLPDLPDKIEKAVGAQPECKVATFIVSETSTNSVACVAPFTVKSVAADQAANMDLNAAKNEAVRNIEDLQAAVVPPLITRLVVNMEKNVPVIQKNAMEILSNPTTMEVSVASDIAVVFSLNVNQIAATADLEPEVQLKKPLIISAASSMVNDREEDAINQTASANANENGSQNLQNDPAYKDPSAVQKRDGQGTIAVIT